MRNIALITLALSAAVASSAMADSPSKTDTTAMAAKTDGTTTAAKTAKTAKSVKPAAMTCEDFLLYDEVTRPQIVYLSEGLNRKGKPEEAVVDVERVNSMIPMLVEDCQKEPTSSYWKKMKARFAM